MQRVVRTFIATAVVTTVLGTTVGPASAEHWSGRDRAGDVEQITFPPEPSSCDTYEFAGAPQDSSTDIVGLSVVHDGATVVLRARYRELTGFLDRRVEFALETNTNDYAVNVFKFRGQFLVDLADEPVEPEPEPQPEAGGDCLYDFVSTSFGCEVGRRVVPKRNVVEVRVPRKCIGNPRWIRAGVSNFRSVRGSYRIDVWGRASIETILDDPPLSPRVRHSADIERTKFPSEAPMSAG